MLVQFLSCAVIYLKYNAVRFGLVFLAGLVMYWCVIY